MEDRAVKHKAKLLVLMMVTACSTESKTNGGPPSTEQAVQVIQTADANSGGDLASNETEAIPVEASNGVPSIPSPDVNPDVIAEEKISPPNQVTGAYLTATLLPRASESDPLRVGLIAELGKERVSQKDGYHTSWQLTYLEFISNPVKLVSSVDGAYDQVIEFYGTAEEFQLYSGSINVFMQVSEKDSTLNSLVSESLSSLVAGQSIPEPQTVDETETDSGNVSGEPTSGEPDLTETEGGVKPGPIEDPTVVTEVEPGTKGQAETSENASVTM